MSLINGDELRRCAQSRCIALQRRLLRSPAPEIAHRSLLRLIDAELRSLAAGAAPISSNVGHLEAVARVVLNPAVRSVSRVSKPIPIVSAGAVHVDVVCVLSGTPVWIMVSDRNPRYVSWLGRCGGEKGLRGRVEGVLAAARAAGPLKPSSLIFVFARGVDGDVAEKMVDEFGAVKVDFFGGDQGADEVFEEMEDGWIGVERWIGSGNDVVFEIRIDGDCDQSVDRELGFKEEREEEKEKGEKADCLGDQFESLISKMNADASDTVNFDTTTLVAIVSGISNGGCERLLKAPETEMRTRFKGNYEFVMAQVMSELNQPILQEIEIFVAGKKGIICQSVLSEFKELIKMCGGPNEKLRAAEIIKKLRIVVDFPSTRMMDLPTTRKIALKNKIVFGTGDHWHAPTLTANSGFVRAVSQTAMSLLTIEHRPRALTGD